MVRSSRGRRPCRRSHGRDLQLLLRGRIGQDGRPDRRIQQPRVRHDHRGPSHRHHCSEACGNTGDQGMTTALMVGGVICVAIAVAGGTAQSLKTTFIIGGNPRNVMIGMFVAVAVGAVAAAGTLMLLDTAYGIGEKEVPAPQATLMQMIVQGIMTAELPW